ncbi:MAG: YeeE/YedE family protein [bacterium]|nr:YeeE/YedE family protein [bacterium]
MPFYLLVTFGILFGIGFGYFVQRAGLCFAHGLGEIYIGRGKRIIRLFLVVFAITSVGFLLSGYVSPSLGLKPIGQLRGYGFYNLLSGMLFGAGIALSGGCILGTLRQLGEGNLTFLIVLVCFIPGLALVVYGLNPLLEGGYSVQKLLLPDVLGVAAPYVTAILAAAAVIWFLAIRRPRRRLA